MQSSISNVSISNMNKYTYNFVEKKRSLSFTAKKTKPVLNIKSRGIFPANVLSNFSPTNFYFDGVQIISIEGFLQSLKCNSAQRQKEICKMDGITAKAISKSLKQSKDERLFFWNGQEYLECSPEFKELLRDVIKVQKKSHSKNGFDFCGYNINSVNAFLLGIKTPDISKQLKLFQIPIDRIKEVAKTIEPIYNYRILNWQGKTFSRISDEYQHLLNRIYDTRYDNDLIFRQAIRESKKYEICHSKGKKNPRETILTEDEFINQIKRLQKRDARYTGYIDCIKIYFFNAKLRLIKLFKK